MPYRLTFVAMTLFVGVGTPSATNITAKETRVVAKEAFEFGFAFVEHYLYLCNMRSTFVGHDSLLIS